MGLMLPPAAQVHAIVVGVERYALGSSFDAPGAVAGALAFARWLVLQRGVPVASLDLWLEPLGGGDLATLADAAGLTGAQLHRFNGNTFFHAMKEPTGAALHGRFLVVYFCGHGLVSDSRSLQHLVMPEATESQLVCIDTDNWRELFKTAGWERYGHQLWVVDACRNTWTGALGLLPRPWSVGAVQAVSQCVMLSCASGQTSALDAVHGPRFTRELLPRLAAAAPGEWPDFEQALRDTAAALRADPALAQSPTILLGQDWDGLPLLGSGLAGRRLADVVRDINWDYARLKPYVTRAIPASASRAVPDDWPAALELLHGLLPHEGVPPHIDLAERLARATGDTVLRDWVESNTSAQQRAQLQQRMADAACRARLLLWYRDDGAPARIEGELQIIDVGAGVAPWPRAPAKPVVGDAVCATLGQWLQAVYDHVGSPALELEVEIYLPRRLLTAAAYDTAHVPMGKEPALRLGDDHPALLRCTDRYKGAVKLKRLQRHAPRILARLGVAGSDPLRWAETGEDCQALRSAFIADLPQAPAWLGFDPLEYGGEGPLDTAIDEGLPAVLWLREPLATGGRALLQASLRALLGGGLAELPGRLVDWRSRQTDAAGRTVALLVDDPARRPALLNAWTQATG